MIALSPEEYINACDADLKILELDRWERLAGLSESDPALFMRSHYVDAFRNHFGFEPQQRHEVRKALERLQQTGRASVNDVLAPFQASGFSD